MARTLGRTLTELRESISEAELMLFFASYQLDPWGEERADWREAMIGSAVVSCWAKKGVKPDELLVKWDREPPTQEQMAEKFLAWAKGG